MFSWTWSCAKCYFCPKPLFTKLLEKFWFVFSVLPGLGPAPGARNYGARTARQRPRYLPPGGYEVPVGLFSWQECRYKNKRMMLGAGFSCCILYRAFGRVACNYCFNFLQGKSCLKKKKRKHFWNGFNHCISMVRGAEPGAFFARNADTCAAGFWLSRCFWSRSHQQHLHNL